MDQQLELEAKRRVVKGEILALKERIPAAHILNWFGHLLSKHTTNRDFLYWFSAVLFLNLAVYWIWVPVGLGLHEIQQKTFLWTAGLFSTEMQIVGLVVNYYLMRDLFDRISDQIVEKIDNVVDLTKFAEWLHISLSGRQVRAFILLLCLFWMSLGIGAVSFAYHAFVGWGFSLTMLCSGLVAAVALQGIYWENTLVSNLRFYQYDLHAFSPADSELVSSFLDIFNSQLYGVAAYFALYTFLGSTDLVDKNIRAVFAIPMFAIIWFGIISQFLITRNTLGHLIKNAKWKLLNRIQAQINSIEATSDLSDKETAAKLLRLADIHARVLAAKSNIFDLKSVSTVVSQLMLPLLGLLLGNLDKIIRFLR